MTTDCSTDTFKSHTIDVFKHPEDMLGTRTFRSFFYATVLLVTRNDNQFILFSFSTYILAFSNTLMQIVPKRFLSFFIIQIARYICTLNNQPSPESTVLWSGKELFVFLFVVVVVFFCFFFTKHIVGSFHSVYRHGLLRDKQQWHIFAYTFL